MADPPRDQVRPALVACGADLVLAVLFLVDLTTVLLAYPPGITSMRVMRDVVQVTVPLHLGLSLYDGRFGGVRFATWIFVVLAQAAFMAISFANYVVFPPILRAWVDDSSGGLTSGMTGDAVSLAAWLAMLVLAGALAMDMVALHVRT